MAYQDYTIPGHCSVCNSYTLCRRDWVDNTLKCSSHGGSIVTAEGAWMTIRIILILMLLAGNAFAAYTANDNVVVDDQANCFAEELLTPAAAEILKADPLVRVCRIGADGNYEIIPKKERTA